MSGAVQTYASQGITAFSVNISWDPSAKKGKGGKRSLHPNSWPTAGGFSDPTWNSVAINTEKSGLVVVDFDDDNSYEIFKQRASDNGIPIATREARSGSGVGGHLYFRSIPDKPLLKSTDNIEIFGMSRGTSKVDIKASGGLIYAPPSKYNMPDGTTREYCWVNNLEMETLPLALYDLLPKKDDPPARQVRCMDDSREPNVATNCNGNSSHLDISSGNEDPISAMETIKLLSKIDDSRASGGRNSDWLRIGMALKRNEVLLQKAGRNEEASVMLTFFDVFSMRSTQYPGHNAIEKDWRGFKPAFDRANAVTMASVVHMAKEDSEKSNAQNVDSVKTLISNHIDCPVQNIVLTRENESRLRISSPKGDGFIDLTDLKVFLPNQRIDLTGPGSLKLCQSVVKHTKKYVKDLDEKEVLEYHRDNADVALIKQKFSNVPLIKVMDPHSNDATFKCTFHGNNFLVPSSEVDDFTSILRTSLAVACERAIGTDMYGQIVNYGTINNIVVKANVETDKTPTLMLGFQETIFQHVAEHRLMKRNGVIYEPIPGLPCAYRPGPSYKDFLSKLFRSNKDIRSSSKHLGNLVEILTDHVHLEEFPEHNPNPCLMSFDNGVLDIAKMKFVDNKDICEGHPLRAQATCNYIEGVYTGITDTPTLDTVFDYQDFTSETKTFVCGLMGRMLFPVKMLDSWEVILYVFGVAGSGKSLTLEVIENHFDPEVIGGFASKMDGSFPLEGFIGKRVVINKETERKMLMSVNESDLKNMASGEAVTVNRKNKTSVRIQRWEAPIALGSNFLPSFSKENSDSLGRRIVPIRHSNVVGSRDTSLKQKLRKEMPNITARILTAYHSLREKIGDSDIMQHLPDQIKEWGGEIKSQTSKLYDFLSIPDEERVVEINDKKFQIKFQMSEGDIVSKKEFSEFFELWSETKFVNEAAAFSDFGFYSPDTPINVCPFCSKKHKSNCCDLYNNKDKRKRNAIANMVIVKTQLP